MLVQRADQFPDFAERQVTGDVMDVFPDGAPPTFIDHFRDRLTRAAAVGSFMLKPGMHEPIDAVSDHYRTPEERAEAERVRAQELREHFDKSGLGFGD